MDDTTTRKMVIVYSDVTKGRVEGYLCNVPDGPIGRIVLPGILRVRRYVSTHGAMTAARCRIGRNALSNNGIAALTHPRGVLYSRATFNVLIAYARYLGVEIAFSHDTRWRPDRDDIWRAVRVEADARF